MLVTSMGGVSQWCACLPPRRLSCMRASGHPPIRKLGIYMFATTESGLSSSGKPESVFISWLLWQPRGADLAVEALKEMQKLARYQGTDPDITRLTALFASLAGTRNSMH